MIPIQLNGQLGRYTDKTNPCTPYSSGRLLIAVLLVILSVNIACSKENTPVVVGNNILAFDFEIFYRFLEDEAVTDEDVEKLCDEVHTLTHQHYYDTKYYYITIKTIEKIRTLHFHIADLTSIHLMLEIRPCAPVRNC